MNLALLHSPTAAQTQIEISTDDDRTPFQHPALEGLPNITNVPIADILTKTRLARLANQKGMQEILRWKPRMVSLPTCNPVRNAKILTY